jgi:3,4-dihydroxy 2-butanone 4-phosphate synthase
MKKYPILQRMGKDKKYMCQSSCSVGFSFDHRSLKIGVSNVERIFTCHQLVELWQEVVNLKNEVDRKEAATLFAKEFNAPSHIFLCIENAGGLQVPNGHIELSVALGKLVGVVPILVCQNPFYKTLSIPKLLNWHILLFDTTTMLFSCFMGLLMMFIEFNFF